MITAVDIKEKKGKGLLSLFPFHSNKIRVEHLFCDKAALKCITYEKYRKAVNWSVIDRFVKAQRNHLLCREDLPLPKEGYRRFESFELMERMAENAALYLLEQAADKNPAVVLVDRDASCVGLSKYLLDCSDRVTVLTDSTALYLDEAAYLMEEKGAVLRVSKSSSPLKEADIIIAPKQLKQTLKVKSGAVIFTSRKPEAVQPCTVIFQYFFDLPEKYERIRPPFLEKMYFAGAMYTLSNAYELGSELFRFCSDGETVHTRGSLTAAFRESREKIPL